MGRRPKAYKYAEFGLSSVEDVAAVKRRIHACRKFGQDKFGADAKSLLDYYEGNQYDTTPGNNLGEGDHRIVVNKVLPNIELKVDTVAFAKPEFILTPRNQAGDERKQIAKSALEYYFETGNYMDELRAALRDSKIVRYGAVRITWAFETDEIVMQDGRQRVDGDAPLDPMAVAELASEGIDAASLPTVSSDLVIEDAPRIERIRPTDLLFDPASDWDLDRARFICYREVQPLEDVQANPRFDPAVTGKLKGNSFYDESLLDEQVTRQSEEDRPDDIKSVTLWHYFERRRRLHCVYADEDMENPVLVERFPWKFKGYPFAIIISHVIPDKTPGECLSDVDLVRPLQDSLNHTRSLQQGHVEQFTAKYQCKQGVMTAHSRRQMKSSRRGTVVEHNGMSDNAIAPLQVPPIPQDVYSLEASSTRDMDYLTGVSDYQRNMMPQGGRRTATEVAALQQTGSGRVDSDVIKFSKFVAQATKKVLGLLQQFHDHVQMIPVYDNVTNAATWTAFTREQIAGEYDLSVEIGSTEAKNQEAEKQNLLFALQTLTPYLQVVDPMTGQPLINPAPLLRKVFETFGIKNAAEIIGPPMQQQPAPMAAPPAPGMPMDPAAGGGMDPMAALAAQMGGGGMPF